MYASPHDISVTNNIINTKHYNNSSYNAFKRIENKKIDKHGNNPIHNKTIAFNGNRVEYQMTNHAEQNYEDKTLVHSIIGQ